MLALTFTLSLVSQATAHLFPIVFPVKEETPQELAALAWAHYVPRRRPSTREGPLGIRRIELDPDWFVSDLRSVGDFDGDGQGDVLVNLVRRMMCGSDIHAGAAFVLSGTSLEPIALVQRGGHLSLDPGRGAGPNDPWLILEKSNRTSSTLTVRPSLSAEPTWSRNEFETPLGQIAEARWVGDLDGDGIEDVLASNAWAYGREGKMDFGLRYANMTGSAIALSGATGELLWQVFGRRVGEGFGMDLRAARDLDADGVDDVLILVASADGAKNSSNRLEWLSGRTGETLDEVGLGELDPYELKAVGDFDGDGRSEVWFDMPGFLQEPTRIGRVDREASSPLRIKPDLGRLAATLGGDLDGDGADDLIALIRNQGEASAQLVLRTLAGDRQLLSVTGIAESSSVQVCAVPSWDPRRPHVILAESSGFSARDNANRIGLIPAWALSY